MSSLVSWQPVAKVQLYSTGATSRLGAPAAARPPVASLTAGQCNAGLSRRIAAVARRPALGSFSPRVQIRGPRLEPCRHGVKGRKPVGACNVATGTCPRNSAYSDTQGKRKSIRCVHAVVVTSPVRKSATLVSRQLEVGPPPPCDPATGGGAVEAHVGRIPDIAGTRERAVVADPPRHQRQIAAWRQYREQGGPARLVDDAGAR